MRFVQLPSLQLPRHDHTCARTRQAGLPFMCCKHTHYICLMTGLDLDHLQDRKEEDAVSDAVAVNSLPHATVSDMAHLQRTGAACMVPLRSLGRGAFAAVELVSMPVAGKRKLLVCKKLMSDTKTGESNSTACHFSLQQQQPWAGQLQLPPPLKLSSLQDWSREVTMHRETAGCPFVLQLLAAKRCRAGNMLLLTEYAAAGSITDVLARMRLQQNRMQYTQQQQKFRRCQSAAAVLQCEKSQQDTTALAQHSQEPAFLCAGNTASVAALCNALRDGTAPTAMLIHGVDIDVAPAVESSLHAAAATGAAAAFPPEGTGLREDAARFYTACILMGLEWLHSRRILHRDIKPCNLLLFSDGYLKLADLGCCCLLPPGINSARTRTGTAQYMAPEITCKNNTDGYSFPVDMWSLGVTLWQMVAGSLPDWAEQQQRQHRRSSSHGQQRCSSQEGAQQTDLHGDDSLMLPLGPVTVCHTTPKHLEFPATFSKELCDLLTGLLEADSSARLSISEVQATSWFEGFDWQSLQDKTLTPPVLPAHALQHMQQVPPTNSEHVLADPHS